MQIPAASGGPGYAWLMCCLVTSATFFWPLILAAAAEQDAPFPATETLDESKLDTLSQEKDLISKLLKRYNKIGRSGRPVLNSSLPLHVSFGLSLIQLDLNEKDKVLTLSMWTKYQWRDEFLQWRPEDHDGITSIRLHASLIWIPDIMLYNTADVDVQSRQALAVIAANGLVTWYPHTIFRSSCSVDSTNFPFDSQQCHLWFGSWTHDSKQLNLSMGHEDGIDLRSFQADFKDSNPWNVVKVKADVKMLQAGPGSEFVVLAFAMNLQRRMNFSSYILTLPCVFLACLTLVVFWLPPDRPDRTALAMSTFGSFMVLLLILVESAPPSSSSVPTLGIYYCFNMVIIMLSIFLSTVVVNVSRNGVRGNRPPSCLRSLFFGGVAKVICQTRRGSSCMQLRKDSSSEEREAGRATAEETKQLIKDSAATTEAEGFELRDLKSVLIRLESKLDSSAARKKQELQIRSEWNHIGLALDRMFFMLYLALIVISLTVLFPRPKPQI